MTKTQIKMLNKALKKNGFYQAIAGYKIPVKFKLGNEGYLAVIHTWGYNLYKELVPKEESNAKVIEKSIQNLLKTLNIEESYNIRKYADIAKYRGKVIFSSTSVCMLFEER